MGYSGIETQKRQLVNDQGHFKLNEGYQISNEEYKDFWNGLGYSSEELTDKVLRMRELAIRLHPMDQKLYQMKFIDMATDQQICASFKVKKRQIEGRIAALKKKLKIIEQIPDVDIDRYLVNLISKRDRLIVSTFIETFSITETASIVGVGRTRVSHTIKNAQSLVNHPQTSKALKMYIKFASELQFYNRG